VSLTSNRDTYVRYARLERVIDGDTVDLVVDMGWNLTQLVRFRLLGVDTPELRSSDPDERREAAIARDFVFQTLTAWSNLGDGAMHTFPLWVDSRKTGKYGRWLANIGSRGEAENETLNDLLLFEGLAKEYPA